ncbi:MAG: xanthine dehydrogenase family protein subunit M [Acidimicrobiaceae bacterium]|nr:xanthine dehydrogenase family protein subunit M [Acidimicrobiaceae bacterium]
MLRPESIAEACDLLNQDGDALVYGGGTALQILHKQGFLSASSFVDISGIPGLADISIIADGLRIGPMVSIRHMERDAMVKQSIPLASAAYSKVANPRIRNTATVGGNIAHGDYRLDPPVALLVLGATIELSSIGGIRRVSIEDFFVGFQVTEIKQGELITAVEIPVSNKITASNYVKLSSLSANDWPSASAAVAIIGNQGNPQTLRFALGALAPTPVLSTIEISGLQEDEIIEAALEQAMQMMDPLPDIRGGAEYKRKLGRVAVEDAVRNAWRSNPSE